MNTNTDERKVAVACFAGIAVTSGLFFTLPLSLWWLALLAGAAAGYVGYDVLHWKTAVPQAFARAWPKAASFGKVVRTIARDLWAEPRFRAGVLLAAPFAVVLPWLAHVFDPPTKSFDYLFLCALAPLLFGLFASAFVSRIGQRWRKQYVDRWDIGEEPEFRPRGCLSYDAWWRRSGTEGCLAARYKDYLRECFRACGWTEVQPTASTVIVWVLCAPLVVARGFVRLVVAAIVGIPSFCRHLFVAVHCGERRLCAIDSVVLGVIGTYLLWGAPAPWPLLVAICSVIGAAVGRLHYRLTRSWVARLCPA